LPTSIQRIMEREHGHSVGKLTVLSTLTGSSRTCGAYAAACLFIQEPRLAFCRSYQYEHPARKARRPHHNVSNCNRAHVGGFGHPPIRPQINIRSSKTPDYLARSTQTTAAATSSKNVTARITAMSASDRKVCITCILAHTDQSGRHCESLVHLCGQVKLTGHNCQYCSARLAERLRSPGRSSTLRDAWRAFNMSDCPLSPFKGS